MTDAEMKSEIALIPENFPHLSWVEWAALQRMAEVSGSTLCEHLLRDLSPESHRMAAHEFIERELNMARSSTPVPPPTPRVQPLKLDVSSYDGAVSTPLLRWFCEIDTAIHARQIFDQEMQVAFLMSKLSGRARTWAYGKRLADPLCFVNLEELKRELRAAFEPPQSEFRMRTAFLAVRQGSLDLHDYVQKVRYMASCVVSAPIDMATQVTTFMTGLRDGPVKTHLFREYPSTLEEAFSIALREDFSARQARSHSYRQQGGNTVNYAPEPMDISSITHGNARGSFQKTRFRSSNSASRSSKCFRCQKLGHYAAQCRAPAPNADARGQTEERYMPSDHRRKNELVQ